MWEIVDFILTQFFLLKHDLQNMVGLEKEKEKVLKMKW